jgi:protein-tyrosine-phosphatase
MTRQHCWARELARCEVWRDEKYREQETGSRDTLKIHFICTGNIYRSRLAEAYCASKCVPGLDVISSGIGAGLYEQIPISPYAADLLTRFDLTDYAAKHWQRTNAELVRASDVLVFLESEHLRYCENWIEPARQKIEVWEIEDIGPIAPAMIPMKAERTFAVIRQRVDELLDEMNLKKTEAGE